MASDGSPSERQTLTKVLVRRLARYARSASRPGGIRYLIRRFREECERWSQTIAMRAQEIGAKVQEIVTSVQGSSRLLLQSLVTRAYEKSELLIRLSRLENLDSMLVSSNQLGKLVAKHIRMKNRPIDIAIISAIEDYVVAAGIAALPRPARRIFEVAEPTERSRCNFNIAIPRDHAATEAGTLIIYASPAF